MKITTFAVACASGLAVAIVAGPAAAEGDLLTDAAAFAQTMGVSQSAIDSAVSWVGTAFGVMTGLVWIANEITRVTSSKQDDKILQSVMNALNWLARNTGKNLNADTIDMEAKIAAEVEKRLAAADPEA